MKKTIFFILLSALLCACHTSELEKEVNSMNKGCPRSYGDFGEWTSVKYEDGNVILYFNMNEDYVDIQSLNNMSAAEKEAVKANALQMFGNDQRMKDLIDLAAEDNAGMAIVYTGIQTGAEYRLVFNRRDITKASKMSGDDPIIVLETWLENQNMQFPAEFDEGMVYTHVSFDGHYVVYSIECDETMYDMSELAKNKRLLKEEINEYAQDESFWLPDEKNKYKAANAGIKFKFYGSDSKSTVEITINPDEF